MYKNQLQELAQRSCFTLPSYACIREGPDHAPRFKASVNFNGEIFESTTYATTLRQAEHAAAEAALNSLSARGPSRSLTARVLDETGVYKNLLQETAHRTGLKLPSYTTVRSGPGHVPVFTSTVDLAGMNFTGESAKTKKQAEKNAAIVAWSALKTMPNSGHLWEKQHEDQDHGIGVRIVGGRGESRVIRRRDQYQRRGRRETNSAQQRQWRFMDPLLPTPGLAKQNTVLSLLPPPPPTAISRSLPANLAKDSPPPPTTISRILPANLTKDCPPPPSPAQSVDNEWINRISEAIKKKPLPIHEAVINGSAGNSSSHFYGGNAAYNTPPPGSRIPARIPSPNPTPETARTQKSSSILGPNNQIGRPTISGVYNHHHHPQRIAPAVQIRSVIPVCAAPPVRLRPSTPLMKEASSSLSSTQSELLASTLSKLKL